LFCHINLFCLLWSPGLRCPKCCSHFDRCPCSVSLHPPPAALDCAAQSTRATNCATPG